MSVPSAARGPAKVLLPDLDGLEAPACAVAIGEAFAVAYADGIGKDFTEGNEYLGVYLWAANS